MFTKIIELINYYKLWLAAAQGSLTL